LAVTKGLVGQVEGLVEKFFHHIVWQKRREFTIDIDTDVDNVCCGSRMLYGGSGDVSGGHSA